VHQANLLDALYLKVRGTVQVPENAIKNGCMNGGKVKE
jgi:hypothetical protein